MYKVWLPLHIWCICKSISFLVVIHIKLYFIAYIYTFYTEKILYSIAVEVKIKHFLGRDHWSKWVHLWYIQIPSVPQKSNFYNESSVGALYITYHITNYPSVEKSEIGLDILDNIRIQKIIPDENWERTLLLDNYLSYTIFPTTLVWKSQWQVLIFYKYADKLNLTRKLWMC